MDSPASAEFLLQMSVHLVLSGCLQKTTNLGRWLAHVNHLHQRQQDINTIKPIAASTIAQELWNQMCSICKLPKQEHAHAKIYLVGKDTLKRKTVNGLFCYHIYFSRCMYRRNI